MDSPDCARPRSDVDDYPPERKISPREFVNGRWFLEESAAGASMCGAVMLQHPEAAREIPVLFNGRIYFCFEGLASPGHGTSLSLSA